MLSQTLGIHYLSLLTLTYLYSNDDDTDLIFERIKFEIDNVKAGEKMA